MKRRDLRPIGLDMSDLKDYEEVRNRKRAEKQREEANKPPAPPADPPAGPSVSNVSSPEFLGFSSPPAVQDDNSQTDTQSQSLGGNGDNSNGGGSSMSGISSLATVGGSDVSMGSGMFTMESTSSTTKTGDTSTSTTSGSHSGNLLGPSKLAFITPGSDSMDTMGSGFSAPSTTSGTEDMSCDDIEGAVGGVGVSLETELDDDDDGDTMDGLSDDALLDDNARSADIEYTINLDEDDDTNSAAAMEDIENVNE